MLRPVRKDLLGLPTDFSKSSNVMLSGSTVLSLFVTLFIRDMTLFSIVGLVRGVFPAETQPRSIFRAVTRRLGVKLRFFEEVFLGGFLVLISVVVREDKEFRGAHGALGRRLPTKPQPALK